ncbi:4-coumarate- ligase [Ophiostoma piceae UAMH 11346]|uniref:4-coumarate-ligase n=1 Tax=Ophiostoma piceae (strain UAMH 11346) TaxID=1262450 RepID=S3CBU1_OPHP1|nr:4-coumarate- ligase [Ophiostoma piceae UAMH 11346]
MPFESPYPPVSIPEIDLWSFLFERKSKPFTDSKEIFTDSETGRCYTFGDLRSASLEFGNGIQSLWNWQRGDVMAFYTPNSIDTPPIMLGLLWAGGISSPANPLYTEHELTFQLRDSGAKAVATQLAHLEITRKAAKAAGIPEDRIILLGDQRDPSGKFRHFSDIQSPTATGHKKAVAVGAHGDLAFLVYSSGTTGLPKGVCLTHRNVIANILQMSTVDGLYFHPYGGLDGKGDKGLGITPFFHIYGLVCCVMAFIYLGWELVSMSRFDIERACQLIEKHKLSFAYVPPPVILAFSKHPVVDKYDLTSMRMLHSGAAPLTPELATSLWNRLKIAVKQGYGLSETSPVATLQLPHEWGKFMGSVGKLLPNMQAKLVDPDEEKEVAEGQPGELWLKGPNVFQGYLNLPDNTAATMSPDGYFKTGDIFVVDKHGNLTCVDRLKELIKYKGFQVPPAELEGILLGHSDIVDAGVIGIEDKEQATEVPRAYVVMKPGVATDAAKGKEITEWLASLTAPHKKLRGGLRFVKEIPKSPSGKILRRVLRDQARQESKAGSSKL